MRGMVPRFPSCSSPHRSSMVPCAPYRSHPPARLPRLDICVELRRWCACVWVGMRICRAQASRARIVVSSHVARRRPRRRPRLRRRALPCAAAHPAETTRLPPSPCVAQRVPRGGAGGGGGRGKGGGDVIVVEDAEDAAEGVGWSATVAISIPRLCAYLFA
ncbi:hypothetical protein C8J57DRAFT_436435 [Mycena rebaudengoi]|nr:hypothetical protein C8J57DRAFT_436435 [Mycena rebaudengoi]